MSAIFIRNILSTELTTIPTWTKEILGEYYNNTLCNGVTWMLVIYKIVYILYNNLMHGYLKQLKTKKYIRTRLTSSLWFCGFFTSVLAYYIVTLDENKLDQLRGNLVTLNENLPTDVILSYTLICAFYLHTAVSEGLQAGSTHSFLKIFLLVVICTSAYILRFLEIPITLSAIIAVPIIVEEMTKILHSLLGQLYNLNNIFGGTLFIFNLVLFSLIYLAIIPLFFLVPLGKRIIFEKTNVILIILVLSLIMWLGTAIYKSILVKSIVHWKYHVIEELNQEGAEKTEEEKVKQKFECSGNIIACTLFPERTDEAYVLNIYRAEVKERKMEMEARKKPKARNMIIQTLKYMMAIKKKFRHKNLSESSDSDESSEPEKDTEGHAARNIQNENEDESETELVIKEIYNENKEEEFSEANNTNNDDEDKSDGKIVGNSSVEESVKENLETGVNIDSISDTEDIKRDKIDVIAQVGDETIPIKSEAESEKVENINPADEVKESSSDLMTKKSKFENL